MLRKNVASQYVKFGLVNASTGAALTGATVTGYRALDGAVQAPVTGTFTELGNGQYRFNPSQADTNGDQVGYLFTAASAIPTHANFFTTGGDFANAASFGLTNLDATISSRLAPTTAGRTLDVSAGGEAGVDWANVGSPTTANALTATTIATTQKVDVETVKTQTVSAAGAVTVGAFVGQATAAIGVNASGHVSRVVLVDTLTTYTGNTVQTGDAFARLGAPAGASVSADIAAMAADLPQRPTKNVALAAFMFMMIDSSDDISGKTGLTVTATRSLDGAAFAACANAVTEVSSGWYKIDLAAADLNANVVALRMTGSGANDTNLTIITEPT